MFCCCFPTCALNLPWWCFETSELFNLKSADQKVTWVSLSNSRLWNGARPLTSSSQPLRERSSFSKSLHNKKQGQQMRGQSDLSFRSRCVTLQLVFPDGSNETDLLNFSPSFSRNSGLFVFIYISRFSVSSAFLQLFLQVGRGFTFFVSPLARLEYRQWFI